MILGPLIEGWGISVREFSNVLLRLHTREDTFDHMSHRVLFMLDWDLYWRFGYSQMR